MPGLASTGFGSFVFSRQLVISTFSQVRNVQADISCEVVCTLGFSYPLSLYRDIEKLSKASALALVR